MAIVAASLASGQLPAAKGTLYTSTAKSYVKALVVHNTGASSQTVILYQKLSAGTSKIIFRAVLAENETGYAVDAAAAMSMSAGDTLEGTTTTATQVDYMIVGATEA